jgi:hypothetical protein
MNKVLQIKVTITFMAIALAYGHAGADDLPVRGFDAAVYEYSFVGADRMFDPERWLSEARVGVAFSIARWERSASELYTDRDSLESARQALRSWTDDDMATRFSRWLSDRFFGSAAAALRESVSSHTRIANRRYLYSHDTNEAFVYDEAGNPVYVAYGDSESLEQDRAGWHMLTENTVANALLEYGACIEFLRPEILSFIPPEERDKYEDLITSAANTAKGRVARQLDLLVEREERLFVARKTSDVWSLRGRSEGETASSISESLALETARSCEAGLAALDARIEAAGAGTGDLALAGTGWLEDFEAQFDKGLVAWKDAEESFLGRRFEWDRDSAGSFDEGNSAWARALEKLAAERKSWEVKAGELLEKGGEAFSRAGETLETNIIRARVELERATAEWTSASSSRAEAWVDIYLQSSSTASSAREGAVYWLSRLGSGAPDLSADNLETWLDVENQKPDAGPDRKNAITQVQSLISLAAEFKIKATEAKNQLIESFGLELGTQSGSLCAVLEEGASSEDFNLDEYQVELIRAKAVEGYWQRRVEVASAVYEYASDISAGRATEGDNVVNLQKAVVEYEQSMLDYDVACASLEAAGSAIGEARAGMESSRALLTVAVNRLESADSEYANLLAVMAAGDASFIRENLFNHYRALLAQSGLSNDADAPSEANLVARYLEKARKAGLAGDIEKMGEALKYAVNGTTGEPSLKDLSHAWESIVTAPENPLSDYAAYGIAEANPACFTIQYILGEMRSLLENEVYESGKIAIQNASLELAHMVAEDAKQRAAIALESRIDGIALLAARSSGDWFEKISRGSILHGTVDATIAYECNHSMIELIEARARLELAALETVLGLPERQAGETDASSLATWWRGDEQAAVEAYTSLKPLVALFDGNLETDDDSIAVYLDEMAEHDHVMSSFIQGHGFFNIAGCDISPLHLASEVAMVERAEGIKNAWNRYGPLSCGLDVERWSAMLAGLDSDLSALGLSLDEHGNLPDLSLVCSEIFSSGHNVETALLTLSDAADNAASLAPEWLANELAGWKDSLVEYAVAKSIMLGMGTPKPSSMYMAELSAIHKRLSDIQTIIVQPGEDAAAIEILASESMALVQSEKLASLRLDFSLAWERNSKYADEAHNAGTKHWRQYLDDGMIRDAASFAGESTMILPVPAGNPEGGINIAPRAADTWAEGVLADKYEEAGRHVSSLGSAMLSWSAMIDARNELGSTFNVDFEKFKSIASAYMTETRTMFNEGDIFRAPSLLYREYDMAYAEYLAIGLRREESCLAIVRLGKDWETASDSTVFTDRLESLRGDLETMRNELEQLMLDYRIAGKTFDTENLMYNVAYDTVKRMYEEQEYHRQACVKEDAIQRWASSAYLAVADETALGADAESYRSPAAELLFASDSYARAKAALTILENLYDNDEAARPYSDVEYSEAYAVYYKNYRRMMLVAKARDAIGSSRNDEYTVNETAYQAYVSALSGMEIREPEDRFKELVRIDADGQMRFAYDSSFNFSDSSSESVLDAYFSEPLTVDSGGHRESSAFQHGINAMMEWMGTHDFTIEKAKQWGLARDYVLGKLAASNDEFSGLIQFDETAVDENLLGGNRFSLLSETLSEILSDFRSNELFDQQKNAFESMGIEELSWFESYLALQASGAMKRPVGDIGSGSETFDSFAYWSRVAEYERLEAEAVRESRICQNGIKASTAAYLGFTAAAAVAGALIFTAWLSPILLASAAVAYVSIVGFGLTANGIEETRMAYSAEMENVVSETRSNVSSMTEGMKNSTSALHEYLSSCERLDQLNASLQPALIQTGEFDMLQIEEILALNTKRIEGDGAFSTNASCAIKELDEWMHASHDDGKSVMHQTYVDDEIARLNAQDRYRFAYNGFLSGSSSDTVLELAVQAAYGPRVSSTKKYLHDLALVESAIGFPETDQPISCEQAEAAHALSTLVEQASVARYQAELSAREAEWDTKRIELYNSNMAWKEAANLILVRGRADFVKAGDTLRERYSTWRKKFVDVYTVKKAAWDFAYTDMGTRKSAWVMQATEAANEASSGAFLALVGSDAEADARRIDSFSISEIEIACTADMDVDNLMAANGIRGMAAAMSDQRGLGPSLGGMVRTGVGNAVYPDSGAIQIIATDLADRGSRILAGAQARIMASRARSLAQAALEKLDQSIRQSNEGFNSTMNRIFVSDGRWQRQGRNYVKDIVVHSTVGDPFITEQAVVEGFQHYAKAPWIFRTDLSDGSLKNLDPWGIRSLIRTAQDEVAIRSDEVFGTIDENSDEAIRARTRSIDVYRKERAVIGTQNISWTDHDGYDHDETINTYGMIDVLDHTQDQVMGAGLFGKYIGYAPVVKIGAEPAEGESTLFQSIGVGELGRLMAKFIYWSMKESQGWSEANKPVYEKDLWDDRGDWFQAPSIRGIADVGMTVVAGALTGGVGAIALNLADDLAFGALDGIAGYRSWEEASLNFGKKVAISTINAGVGQIFSGAVSSVQTMNGVEGIVGRTTITGMRSFVSEIASSATNAMYWDENGLGWSDEIFNSGIRNGLTGTMAGIAGGNVSGVLNLGLEGFTGRIYSDGLAFSNLVGGVAGQGLSYALSGTASFNLASLNSTGILQLTLRDDGVVMGLGTGGVDTSLGVLTHAARGLEAWGVNTRMAISGQDEAVRYASALRTLYSGEDLQSEKRDLFERLLAGKTNIKQNVTGDYKAETVYDAHAGTSVISLGRDAMIDESRFGLNILLAHEAYRNGIHDGEVLQAYETQRSVLSHVQVAGALGSTYGMNTLNGAQRGEVEALRSAYAGDITGVIGVVSSYDSRADLWRLDRNGGLAYDGLATLRDENGNVIRSASEMGLKETQIEGSLLTILGINPDNDERAEAVRHLMVASGLQHSYSEDSREWMWRGTRFTTEGTDVSFSKPISVDLSAVNQGLSIDLGSINDFYGSIEADKATVGGFIGNTYGSAIAMLNYAETDFKSSAEQLLANVYSASQVKMIKANQEWYNGAIREGISVDSMVSGSASRTTAFGADTGDLALATSSVSGAAYFSEQHTGIDFGSGGSSVMTPGGFWQFDRRDDHRAYFQLFGGDLRMRVMHIDPKEIKSLNKGDIIGDGSSPKVLFDYPVDSYGTGTGAHVHIDFTRRLPYQSKYQRQFIDPETMKPGSIFNYSFSYKDTSHEFLAGYPQSFMRY